MGQGGQVVGRQGGVTATLAQGHEFRGEQVRVVAGLPAIATDFRVPQQRPAATARDDGKITRGRAEP